ncbi:MAG: phenylalanine--tRNA ligase subunit beta [Acidobacteria bacterium]|nr:phenylalanine--tRNA ligase subunit beta [Acidobacteriota bacterium]
MRLVTSWLREFVDVKASADDIAATLGLRGFEVASIEPDINHNGDGDAVIDFEITANRPDCLSVLGLAREVATAYDLPIMLPSADAGAKSRLATLPAGTSEWLKVTLEDEDLCPRYAAAIAEVTIGSSPAWMAARLQAAGVRPISTLVDITNYVNLEIGQPMHAFDLAKLAGAEIRVRRAKPGETITTLDGVHRKLEPDMLVIADRDRAQAIAGVMGGAASEVSAETTLVAFESAYFTPASVRRTSKRLGLKTEASSRFERGADPGAQALAIQRAVALMEQITTGRPLGPIVDCAARQAEPKRVHLRRARLALLLGVAVPDADVERILRSLGLEVTRTADGWDAIAPTFRVDLLREVDLIEEAGRHYGFDKLTATFPVMTQPAPAPDARIPRDQTVRRVLTAAGLSEAVTFGFIEAKASELFVATTPVPAIAVANPLSGKFDTLRPSLLPGLVDAVAHNRRHGRRDVRLFEIGARFAPDGETRGVAIAWTGGGSAEHWSAATREVDFFDAKGVAEQLCGVLDVPVRFKPLREPFLVAGLAASIVAAQATSRTVADGPEPGAVIGLVGQLAPAVADARGLPRQDPVFVAELNLDRLERARVAASDATRPLPRHPFVIRDLSIVVPDALPAEIIRGTIHAAGRETAAPLTATSFFDRYQGKGVPPGAVSLSVRLTFQALDRTLTDAEIQQSVDTILAALVREHGAQQR